MTSESGVVQRVVGVGRVCCWISTQVSVVSVQDCLDAASFAAYDPATVCLSAGRRAACKSLLFLFLLICR